MNRIITVALVLILGAGLFCGKRQTVKAPAGDQLLWASETPRPSWTYKEALGSEGMQVVVGMSHKYADEKSAREDAEREARIRAARYLETAVREAFERITAELGLASTVLNPSVAARGYAEMQAQAVIQNSKVVEFYVEQRRSAETGEIYFLSFAKLLLPDEQVRESFSDYTKRKRDEWKLSQEQIQRVNDVFRQYWESKKKEESLREEQKE